jgi:hypothetical protein
LIATSANTLSCPSSLSLSQDSYGSSHSRCAEFSPDGAFLFSLALHADLTHPSVGQAQGNASIFNVKPIVPRAAISQALLRIRAVCPNPSEKKSSAYALSH